MKKFKVMLSVFMVLIIISVSTTPMLAVVSPEDSFVSTNNWQDKIDDIVWNKMEQATADEKIPVWVWFTDVDKSNVEAMVEKQTGLTKRDLDVSTNISTDELSHTLDLASMKNTVATLENLSNELQDYLSASEEARAIANERTNIYLRAKRNIISEIYVENNDRIISSMNIDENSITFQSQLTPSMIANLTKSEIINISNNNSVVMIGYFDVEELDEPMVTDEIDTMQIDAIKYQYPYSGNDVNVLIYEQAYVRDDYSSFDDRIRDRQKIKIIANKSDNYTPSDHEIMSGTVRTDHAINTAGVLQDCAVGTNLYSVAGGRFEDLEWALQTLDISIINASTNMGEPLFYSDSCEAMWFDSLVNTYDITLVASAGNGIEANTRVLAPACSYNSIAVGAYDTDGKSKNDQMHNFKYAPNSGSDLPCYKPDVVVAAPDTSSAAPLLSGIIAMMIELEPSLSVQPEVIKAILMASCHRKVKPFGTDTQELITDGLTQKQGAGAVDAYRAIRIVLEGTYGYKTATSYGINQTATFALSDADDVNVSIAWSRENVNNGILNTTLGTLQELELNVYNGNTLLGSSARTNAGKQMVYLQNLSSNTLYTIKVKKTTSNTEPITYGYAWSGKNYVQAEMEVVGKTAIGQTLTAELSYIDGKAVANEEVTYVWKRSSDGASWQVIPNENTDMYTITSDDWYKYIKCEATLNDTTLSGDTNVSDATGIRIVLYGDVDMDKEVSAVDITVMQLYLAHMEDFTPEQCYAGDVDGDGDVTAMDATYIQKFIARKITAFPVEE